MATLGLKEKENSFGKAGKMAFEGKGKNRKNNKITCSQSDLNQQPLGY
jgi:hypothetical protein